MIGATGLLGNAVFRFLVEQQVDCFGAIRDMSLASAFSAPLAKRLRKISSVEETSELVSLLDECRPTVIVNCAAAGRPAPVDPMRSISIYSTFAQRLAMLCRERDARLIQISSDGVFAGRRGGYTERDLPDADDLYGVAKFLGEVDDGKAVTLRLSVVGHELAGRSGLLEWFLAQQEICRGHRRSYFSGLASVEIARVIHEFILPRASLTGVYHVAGPRVSKFQLLRELADGYGKAIELVPDDTVVIDRSLDDARFRAETGYSAPSWAVMIGLMKRHTFGLEKASR
ncbi:sugar nucleotide-binding protein [Bosea sp. 2YAB26]|uniref:sugar nucleotide-binding protein n=1 Tax=Bosea sp. 2YAB26 TaxID=3237478 RepID=UPI003F92CBA5